jgi:hypothetical protein
MPLMRPGFTIGLLLLVAGCAVGGLDSPDEAKRRECVVDPNHYFAPGDAGAYEIDAAPDTSLTNCPDGSGERQPYDVVTAPFPAAGPNAEAVVSFKLAPGGCYKIVRCGVDAGEPAVYPVAN